MIQTEGKTVAEVINAVFSALLRQGGRSCNEADQCRNFSVANGKESYCAIGLLIEPIAHAAPNSLIALTDLEYVKRAAKKAKCTKDVVANLVANSTWIAQNSGVASYMQRLHDIPNMDYAVYLTRMGADAEILRKWVLLAGA